MNISELSASQLRQAAAIKDQMARLQQQLTRILGAATPAPTHAEGRKKKRTMSAAARALISAAQTKRWAARKSAPLASQTKRKRKRKLSPAAKALLSAKLKEIWAKRKAAKKK
ncbi:MAG: hypothetical protein V9H26_25815 [Verrucomicrobiota bacterium]